MTPWQHDVAPITRLDATGVTVTCPHCNSQHHHGRSVLGSKHVVAGCHRGFRLCREYAIDNPSQRGNA